LIEGGQFSKKLHTDCRGKAEKGSQAAADAKKSGQRSAQKNTGLSDLGREEDLCRKDRLRRKLRARWTERVKRKKNQRGGDKNLILKRDGPINDNP